MIALSVNKLKKSFGVTNILSDISFSINEGERIGIVGVNGTGKTTLLKILSDIYDYDEGEIYYGKDTSIGYLEQNSNFSSSNTVYEETLSVFNDVLEKEKNLRKLEKEISIKSDTMDETLEKTMNTYSKELEEFEKINGYACQSEAKGILKGLGFKEEDLSKNINVLSGGEKTRVLLGKILLRKPSLLLLDEPTNHLDIEAVEWLEVFLKQYKGTVLMVSHDRYFLNQIVNKVLEIHNKRLRIYHGDYTYFMNERKLREEEELRRFENQQAEIKRQKDVIDKLKSYGREKHVKRARSREKLLDKMDVMDRPDYYKDKAKICFEPEISSGNDVLEVKNIAMGYDDNELLFDNLNFNIYKYDKIGLIGPNGVGKSTLFKIILKELKEKAGTVKYGTNVNIGYYDQEQKNLNLDNTIIEEIRDEKPLMKDGIIRSYLARFLFKSEDVFKMLKDLSGGEKARVSLLKLMLSKSNFLLLDEPTNHLDMEAKDVLEDALMDYDGTLFIISHDRYFLNRVTNKTFELQKSGLKEYLGNYDYYQEKKKEAEELNKLNTESNIETKTKTQIKEERRKEKEKQKEERKIKKQQKELEENIMILEEKIEELNNLLCLEEYYSNPQKSLEINKEKTDCENQLEEYYAMWEEFM